MHLSRRLNVLAAGLCHSLTSQGAVLMILNEVGAMILHEGGIMIFNEVGRMWISYVAQRFWHPVLVIVVIIPLLCSLDSVWLVAPEIVHCSPCGVSCCP